MFWHKIFQFSKGYVILFLSGFSIERFLNLCLKQNIPILRLKKLPDGACVAIYARDFLRIRPIARVTRTRVRISKKRGFPFLRRRYRYRYAFFAGAILFVAFFLVTSQFIWSVEVRGVKKERWAEILSAAREAGVYEGAYLKTLPSGNDIKDIIIQKTEHITWAWVYFKGTKAIVEVREATLPPATVDRDVACDVIAARDALVQQMIVKNGVPAVSAGDVVLCGDVLIAGTITTPEGDYRLAHATGEVYASTWHTAKGIFPRYKTTQVFTGNQKSFFEGKLFSKTFPLYRRITVPFAEYRLEETEHELFGGTEHCSGFGIRQLCYRECTLVKEPLPDEVVAAFAKDSLEAEIAKELLVGAVKKNEELTFQAVDDEHLEVTLTIEFLEQIGWEHPLLPIEKQE